MCKSSPATQALACWAVAFIVLVSSLFAFLGMPATAEGAGEAIGRGIAHTGFSALCVWLLARNSTRAWSWFKFGVFYTGAFLVLGIAATTASFRTATGADQGWPFQAAFPDGWNVQRLSGASSAPQDAALGVREVARLGTEVGAPAIQLACVRREKSDEKFDLDQLVNQMAAKLEEQYASANAVARSVRIEIVNVGRFPTRSLSTSISVQEELVLKQESLVALTDECLFSAQVAAVPSEFADVAEVFHGVIRKIQIR